MATSSNSYEASRLAAVQRYQWLDAPPEAALDGFAELAALVCGAPIAAVSLIDGERLVLKGRKGLEEVTELRREHPLCVRTLATTEVVVVPDTLADEEACKLPLVTKEPGIRFYAGAPLVDPEGYHLGALFVADLCPRNLDDVQRTALSRLAAQVIHLLEVRHSGRRRREQLARFESLIQASADVVWDWDLNSGQTFWNERHAAWFGHRFSDGGPDYEGWKQLIHPDDLAGTVESLEAAARTESGAGAWSAEYRYRRADGTYAWVLDRGRRIPAIAGLGPRMTGTMQDITDRKHAGERLASSEAELRALFAAMQDVILLQHRDGRCLKVAPTRPELLYRPPAEILGRTPREIFSPELADLLEARIAEALTRQCPVRFEYPLPIAGRELWFEATLSPVTEDTVLAVARDITERRRVEQELRRNQRFLEQVMRTVPLIIYVYDLREQRNVFSSRRLEETLGYRAEEIQGLGRDFLPTLLHPEDAARLPGLFQRWETAQDDEVLTVEYRMRAADGSWRWLLGSDTVFERDESGRVRTLIGCARDITKEKAAEARDRQQRGLIEAMMNTSVAAITGLSPDGRIIYANPQAEQVLGLKRSELLHRSYDSPDWHITAPDGSPWPEDQLPFHRVLATGEPVFNVEHAIAWPDGRRRELSINGAPIKDAQGRITSLVFSITDITERQAAAQAMRDEQALNEAILQSPACLFFMINPDGKLRRWNRTVEVVVGRSAAELATVTAVELLAREDQSTGAAAVARCFETGEAQAELRLLTAEGRAVPYFFTARRAELHQLPVLVGMGFDQSESKQAEAEIRRLAAFPEMNPNAVVEFDERGTLRYCNQAGEELARRWGAVRFEDLLTPHIRAVVRESVAADQPSRQLELPYGDRVLAWTFCPMRELGTVHGYVADITERMQQERLAQRSQRLESIGTLAGGIAHDLNNTLTPILAGVELLRLDHPACAELAHEIDQAARRAAALVRQLLTFARGSEGHRQPVCARALLGELEKLVRNTFPRSILVRCELADPLPRVVGNATQLHQVLLNLCINARDAMPEGGTLTLAARSRQLTPAEAAQILSGQPGQFLQLRVSDTGTGIPLKHLDRIFEPFFTTKALDQGTGLGLSTSLGVIKGHGGFINVHSVSGQGSIFDVFLPSADESGGSAPAPSLAGQPHAGRGQFVLFVDDEPAVAGVVERILRRLEYSPLVLTDPVAALEKVKELGATLSYIITDFDMPGMDGLAFARAVRQHLPAVPLIVTSGRLDEAARNAFQQLGVRQFLDKPFAPA